MNAKRMQIWNAMSPVLSNTFANELIRAMRVPNAAALLLCALALAVLPLSPAHAQLQGTQTQGTIAPIPIAIPLFTGDDGQMSADIANIVQADLERSGLFAPLDRASFLEQIRDVNAAPRFPDWRAVQADALVVGRIVNGGEGKVSAEFRPSAAAFGEQPAGERF